jgi:hypothetical protein
MRYVVPIVALLSGGLLLTLRAGRGPDEAWPRSPAYSAAEMRAIAAREQSLEALRQSEGVFRDVLESTKVELRRGEITLSAAVDTVLDAADASAPSFLQGLERNHGALPLRERCAVTLVGHLRVDCQADGTPAEWRQVLTRLRVELENWPAVSSTALASVEAGDGRSPRE